MNSFMLLLKKDFLEIKRSKKWLICILVFMVLALLSVVIARVLPEILNMVLKDAGLGDIFINEVSIADSYSQFIANVGETGWLLIAIMFSFALTKEKNNGTYYMLKSNGVSETKIVLSHFLSKLTLITISYLTSIIFVFIPLNLLLFREYTGVRGLVSLSYLYLNLVFALCCSLFVSSVVKKNIAGIIIVIVLYFVLSILVLIPKIDVFNPMYGIMLSNNTIVKEGYELKDYLINLFSTIGICAILITSSIFLFKNKIKNRI